jgi:hypothetical protein
MVLAEDSAAAGQGVALEIAGLRIVTQRPQDPAEDERREQRGGVVLAQALAAAD